MTAGPHMVDALRESAYARPSFDMFEASSAGIALARADRTFCRLRASAARQTNMRMDER
jgi:hypothetical protein